MKEIVAAKIGNLVTNIPGQIAEAVEANARVEWLDRRHMQLMASMDLGERWTTLAKGKTLFCINDAGEPCSPSTSTAESNNG